MRDKLEQMKYIFGHKGREICITIKPANEALENALVHCNVRNGTVERDFFFHIMN